jgi:hypothetical protein
MGHTPGRGHRRKSDPRKKRRFQKAKAKERDDAKIRYDEAVKQWEEMPEEARKMCPEKDPKRLKRRRRES